MRTAGRSQQKVELSNMVQSDLELSKQRIRRTLVGWSSWLNRMQSLEREEKPDWKSKLVAG